MLTFQSTDSLQGEREMAIIKDFIEIVEKEE
jgi:hypothetical protein